MAKRCLIADTTGNSFRLYETIEHLTCFIKTMFLTSNIQYFSILALGLLTLLWKIYSGHEDQLHFRCAGHSDRQIIQMMLLRPRFWQFYSTCIEGLRSAKWALLSVPVDDAGRSWASHDCRRPDVGRRNPELGITNLPPSARKSARVPSRRGTCCM